MEPTGRRRGVVGGELHGDAQVVVDGELVAGQHVGPGEPVGLHDRGAAVPHRLAQRPARVDGPVQAHGRKQRAQKLLCIPMAKFGHERQPGRRLLLGLLERIVA